MAFHSEDGWRWEAAAIPATPGAEERPGATGGVAPSSFLGRATVVRASPGYAVQGAAMQDVVAIGNRLVAVGWEERRGESAYSTSGAAWVSDDAGATWRSAPPGAFPDDGGRSELSGVEVAGGRFVAAGGNRCCYVQDARQVWVSETGEHWRPVPFPDAHTMTVGDIESYGEVALVVGTTNPASGAEARPVHWRLDRQDQLEQLPAPPVAGELVMGVDDVELVAVDGEHLVAYEFVYGQGFREAARSNPLADMRLAVALTTDDVPLLYAHGDGRWWLFTRD